MLASLIAAGRLVPDRGRVLLDGSADPAAIRRAVALVDTPVVAEPPAAMPVGSIVREELRFAGAPPAAGTRRRCSTASTSCRGRGAPSATCRPTTASGCCSISPRRRPGVRALVLTAPERHGGRAESWTALAHAYAERGMPVLVLGGSAAVEALPADAGAEPAGAAR